jgi:hypothetical protein
VENKTVLNVCRVIYVDFMAYNEVYKIEEVVTYHDGKQLRVESNEVDNLLSDYAYNKKKVG